jgi:hypothetical protein
MPLSQAYVQNGVTVGTTEYSLTQNSTTLTYRTTPGIVQVWIDLSNLTATEEYEFKLYEKIYAAGTARTALDANFVGLQTMPYISAPLHVMHGWESTLKKIAGTDRTFDWSIRLVT